MKINNFSFCQETYFIIFFIVQLFQKNLLILLKHLHFKHYHTSFVKDNSKFPQFVYRVFWNYFSNKIQLYNIFSIFLGNLGRVDFITENEYDLFVRPDTCNPRCRFWFYFSVENTQLDQRVVFNVVNLSRTRCLFQKGLTPVVRSTSRPKW